MLPSCSRKPDKYGRRAVLIVHPGADGRRHLIGELAFHLCEHRHRAPILLSVLHKVLGFSAGGEWGGATLMAAEDAPDHVRGKFGVFPQLGVPASMLLASAVSAIFAAVVSP
ncbi:MFS transporter [Glutamicibacter nicotianae]|uniref:Major facilitator superfamily (MFS) profile domain-containing protein n=1 Tax=Glutamicibacter nicotianae TaxID=37929 RepID=A0ABQ0RIC1_GLUNI|nr:MFS transporter [Glutamicibacter nicotianae]GEC11566.1 hypothetical protein ANI01nite_07690 [Glutamicibacter nicotianae]